MTTPEASALGKPVSYCDRYDPSLLFALPRAPGRAVIGLTASLPFFGADIWNAYELSWLTPRGKPVVAVMTAVVPADSPNIVESKSFKLYLGSFSQTPFDSADDVKRAIQQDVSAACGSSVAIKLIQASGFAGLLLDELAGTLLDRLDLDTTVYHPDPALLSARFDEAPVRETVVSNLLKTNCPVTGQPDWGSVQIRYSGPQIDQASLLRYIISFRQHTGFHEQCVEQIFVDLTRLCKPTELAVYARYTRRGGLDINPFRTNFNQPLPDNARTARQ